MSGRVRRFNLPPRCIASNRKREPWRAHDAARRLSCLRWPKRAHAMTQARFLLRCGLAGASVRFGFPIGEVFEIAIHGDGWGQWGKTWKRRRPSPARALTFEELVADARWSSIRSRRRSRVRGLARHGRGRPCARMAGRSDAAAGTLGVISADLPLWIQQGPDEWRHWPSGRGAGSWSGCGRVRKSTRRSDRRVRRSAERRCNTRRHPRNKRRGRRYLDACQSRQRLCRTSGEGARLPTDISRSFGPCASCEPAPHAARVSVAADTKPRPQPLQLPAALRPQG